VKDKLNVIKFGVYLVVFFLFAYGRWYNLRVIHLGSMGAALFLSINYAAIIGLMSYFTMDLILAQGFLRNKIKYIKISFGYLLILILVNYLGAPSFANKMLVLETCATAIYTLIMVRNDMKKRLNYLLNIENRLPEKYLKSHPLKTTLETVFRLFPYPEPLGLYKIGNATEDAPVYVTGNYELTVRRVCKGLIDQDCWLLVSNSRGINIWCSSLANHFGTEDIVDAIQLTRLSEKVKHKKIVLPQLCAANISKERIEKETGFVADFGPFSIENITEYMQKPLIPEIRLATFTWRERLEMSIGSPIILSIALTFIYNFINLKDLFIMIPAIYVLSILQGIIFPYRLIKNIMVWSIIAGCGIFIFLYVLSCGLWHIMTFRTILTISLGFVYLVNEFSGWSPLLKYNFIPRKKTEITVDASKCIGCNTCIKVCPKGVYLVENRKATVKNLKACVLCKACYKQCPTSAIHHSQDK